MPLSSISLPLSHFAPILQPLLSSQRKLSCFRRIPTSHRFMAWVNIESYGCRLFRVTVSVNITLLFSNMAMENGWTWSFWRCIPYWRWGFSIAMLVYLYWLAARNIYLGLVLRKNIWQRSRFGRYIWAKRNTSCRIQNDVLNNYTRCTCQTPSKHQTWAYSSRCFP